MEITVCRDMCLAINGIKVSSIKIQDIVNYGEELDSIEEKFNKYIESLEVTLSSDLKVVVNGVKDDTIDLTEMLEYGDDVTPLCDKYKMYICAENRQINICGINVNDGNKSAYEQLFDTSGKIKKALATEVITDNAYEVLAIVKGRWHYKIRAIYNPECQFWVTRDTFINLAWLGYIKGFTVKKSGESICITKHLDKDVDKLNRIKAGETVFELDCKGLKDIAVRKWTISGLAFDKDTKELKEVKFKPLYHIDGSHDDKCVVLFVDHFMRVRNSDAYSLSYDCNIKPFGSYTKSIDIKPEHEMYYNSGIGISRSSDGKSTNLTVTKSNNYEVTKELFSNVLDIELI